MWLTKSSASEGLKRETKIGACMYLNFGAMAGRRKLYKTGTKTVNAVNTIERSINERLIMKCLTVQLNNCRRYPQPYAESATYIDELEHQRALDKIFS